MSNYLENLKFYATGRCGAQEMFSKDFTTWWHPKIGGRLVRLIGKDIKFQTREEALKEAKNMKKIFREKLAKERQ